MAEKDSRPQELAPNRLLEAEQGLGTVLLGVPGQWPLFLSGIERKGPRSAIFGHQRGAKLELFL